MTWPFLDCATSYVPARGMGGSLQATVIVIHSAETQELEQSAEGVANYFATGTISSTHATTDEDSIPQSVPLDRVCYGTGEGGANAWTWQIEQAGRASQDRSQWLDEYSRATIVNTATVVREMIALKPAIRPLFLSAGMLAQGDRYGVTSHGEIHAAWPQGDFRDDPGDAYPWDVFFQMVKKDPTEDDKAAFYALLAELARLKQLEEDNMAKAELWKLDPSDGHGDDPTVWLVGATTKHPVVAVPGVDVIGRLRYQGHIVDAPARYPGVKVDAAGVQLVPKWMLDQIVTL